MAYQRLTVPRHLESIIQDGENPDGQTSQGPNGTVKGARGAPGWNKQVDFGPAPQAAAEGVWRGNRTSE